MHVENLWWRHLTSKEPVSAEILLFLFLFDDSFDYIVVADVFFPPLEPAARNQVKGIVKFAPVSLVQNVEVLGHL